MYWLCRLPLSCMYTVSNRLFSPILSPKYPFFSLPTEAGSKKKQPNENEKKWIYSTWNKQDCVFISNKTGTKSHYVKTLWNDRWCKDKRKEKMLVRLYERKSCFFSEFKRIVKSGHASITHLRRWWGCSRIAVGEAMFVRKKYWIDCGYSYVDA